MAKSAKLKTISRRMSSRSGREDGEATRARIIDTAGRLFAEKGYDATTSKDICEEAGTNIAAVNYYFGSREGLYQEVLNEVHNYLFNLDYLTELSQSSMDPRQKLENFIECFVATIVKSCSWPVRIWARETFSPSSPFSEALEARSALKFEMVGRIISDIVDIPMDDASLKLCVLNVMSPFMTLLTISRTRPAPHQSILKANPAKVAEQLKDFIFAGLDTVAKKYKDYKEKEREMVMSTPQEYTPM